MFQRLWKKCQSCIGKFEWVDDPEGDYLLDLEQRIHRLERDVTNLREAYSDSKLQSGK